jgi:hypothetical protein
VALIRAGQPNLYREWVAAQYGLDLQLARVLSMLAEVQQATRAAA